MYGEEAAVLNAAHILNNLANNYSDMKQYNKAEMYYLRALSRFRKLSQCSYNVYLADTLYNRGIDYSSAGNRRRAREIFRQALGNYISLDPTNPNKETIRKKLSSSHKHTTQIEQ